MYWGSPVSKATTNNVGHLDRMFRTVIAGSNGYVKEEVAREVEGYHQLDPITENNTDFTRRLSPKTSQSSTFGVSVVLIVAVGAFFSSM